MAGEVKLPVLVEALPIGRYGGTTQHRGTLQLPRSCKLELTPDTLCSVLPEGVFHGSLLRAQLGVLPEGIRALAGEIRELTVRSTILSEVPAWLGELTRLEVLEIVGSDDSWDKNIVLKALPTELGQMGTIKELVLGNLQGLEEVPDLSGLTSLIRLNIHTCTNIKSLPLSSRWQVGALQELTLTDLSALEELPDLSGLTSLNSLTIGRCGHEKKDGALTGLGRLGALKQLYLNGVRGLEEMLDPSGLTSLISLTIRNCDTETTALHGGFGQMGTLKELTLAFLDGLEELPDLSGLTALVSLMLDYCGKLKEMPGLDKLTSLESLKIRYCEIKALPAGLGQLGALKLLSLYGAYELQQMPDALGKMTALESLELVDCHKLRTLPASIRHLLRLRELAIDQSPLKDMPRIEALTALHTLELVITGDTHGSRVFKTLSRSLPCLHQLDNMRLVVYREHENGNGSFASPRTEDVLAIGRALRAWPLPLFNTVKDDHTNHGFRLGTCWRALGLPAAAAGWSNTTTLEFFRAQQHKVAAFASGTHARLGAASRVLVLDEQTLVMIADEVLGGWSLRKEWRQQEEEEEEEEEVLTSNE